MQNIFICSSGILYFNRKFILFRDFVHLSHSVILYMYHIIISKRHEPYSLYAHILCGSSDYAGKSGPLCKHVQACTVGIYVKYQNLMN